MSNNEKIYLNVGCGDMILEGYTNIDLYSEHADVKADAMHLPYNDSSVDLILNSHIIEHFDFKTGFDLLKEWYRVLRTGGVLVTECPNLLALCRLFVDANEEERITMYPQFFGSPYLPGHLHKFVYTPNQLHWTLSQTGFINIQQVEPMFYPNIKDRCMRFVCNKG